VNVYRDCLPGEPPLDPPDTGGYEQAFAEWVAELDPALSRYLDETVLRRLFAERCERERAYAL
jgi:hypothetical protein